MICWEVARLPPVHHAVDELGDERAVVEGVRQDFPPRYRAATWHPYLHSPKNNRRRDGWPNALGHSPASSEASTTAPPRGSWPGPDVRRRPDLPDCVSPAIPPEACFSRTPPRRTPYALGRFAPYLLRLRLRPWTPDGVERPADDVVPHARQVLHAAPADEHDRVLLQVVAHARDVGRDLDAVGEPDARDLAQRRVRLLRRRGEDAHAHAPLLRRSLKSRAVGLRAKLRATDPDELADRGHLTSNRNTWERHRPGRACRSDRATLQVYGSSGECQGQSGGPGASDPPWRPAARPPDGSPAA